MISETTMQKQMIDLLRLDLSEIGDLQLKRVAAVILGEQVDGSMDALATELFKSNVAVGNILTALLRCELHSVQHLLYHSESGNKHQQVRQLSDCIERFNGFQKIVVSAARKSWQQPVGLEEKTRVLAECKAYWIKKGEVQLHNYFNEMPVTAKVKYLNSSDVHLTVEASSKLAHVFVAAEDMREAMITSPDDKYAIRLAVVDYNNNTLKMVMRSVEKSSAELRQQVRVALDERIAVVINSHRRSYQAFITDISASGIEVAYKDTILLQPGETVVCEWKYGDNKIHLEAVLRRIRTVNASEKRAGLQFITLGPFSGLIRKFMLTRQQSMISKLKKLAAPPWMLGK